MDLLDLLRSKNQAIESFLDLSKELYAYLEKNDFSKLGLYQRKREAIIKALGLYDSKIGEAVGAVAEKEKNSALISDVKKLIAEKEEVVSAIRDLDFKIIRIIEEAKNKIRKQIVIDRKSKDVLGKFKSEWVGRSGSGLDRKL